MLTARAPAKINLALHVRARRTDGYHELESWFYFLDLCDYLQVSDSDDLSLICTGPFGARPELAGDNLVLRAARLLQETAGLKYGAALRLEKHIPLAAGLGGGSADAAATLRLLNRFWGLDWALEALLPLAAQLGADVPACLYATPQLGRGRGELLAPIAHPLASGTQLLLVNPNVPLPTAQVFAAWDGVDRGPLQDLDNSRNDLEAPAMALLPLVGDVLAALRAQAGAGLVRMSGSGATCFARFQNSADRDAAARSLAQARPDWWVYPTNIA